MGISLFTYGKASNPKKPNQEASLSLHAASGKVSSQSQAGITQVTADKAITVVSTTNAVQIQAPKHVLLTAQGAYIKMSGGNIGVHAPGKVDFLASVKSWTGAKSDNNTMTLPKSGNLYYEQFQINDELSGQPLAGEPYQLVNAIGAIVAHGITDAEGKTIRFVSKKADALKVHRG